MSSPAGRRLVIVGFLTVAFASEFSITTPLTVLSKPYVIAASAYILAISMVKQQTIHDSLRGLDLGVWEDAFLPQDGIKPTRGREGFEADIRGESGSEVMAAHGGEN